MEVVTCSKIVAKNLSAMHDARQDFIKSESDKKLRRALRRQIRTSSEVKYVTGDKVYYKRRTNDYWKGPATVYRQENQQVLIKHGSTYQRIHLRRLSLIDCLNLSEMEQNPENKEKGNSYHSKEIRVSGNNEQVGAEMDTDEFDKTILQIEPDNSNADQSDDTCDESLLDNTILPKVKDSVVFIREGRNEWKRRTIHSRAGKQIGKY